MEQQQPATPHRLVNPDTLPPPAGYSNAVAASQGTLVFVGGQTGHRPDGSIDDDLVAQFGQAAENVAEALRASGGSPEHLVQVLIYVTDAAAYRGALGPIGEAYRRHLGKHYPAMALLEVAGLFDPRARIELVATAVVPGESR